jgi:hypothetical protein
MYNTRKLKMRVAFGGSSVVFIREIPMFAKYNLYARIISWSPKGKWLYVQGVFTLPAKQKSQGKPKLPAAGMNIVDPALDSGTSTPDLGIPTTVEGETICAVIYGRYVFKRVTRETVPLQEILRICGYTGDEEIEKKRLEGWQYVQGLEHDWDRDRTLQSVSGI